MSFSVYKDVMILYQHSTLRTKGPPQLLNSSSVQQHGSFLDPHQAECAKTCSSAELEYLESAAPKSLLQISTYGCCNYRMLLLLRNSCKERQGRSDLKALSNQLPVTVGLKPPHEALVL